MVPRISKQGRSFLGAGRYYLHDKEADTSERVSFTHTENLPTDDPQMALKWMAYTAMDAEKIKQQAGVKRTGEPAQKPVWTLSLSWHPEQEPTQESMIDAMNSALAHLGLEEHQAVMIGHNDTEHKHIHGIVNLAHPETGRSASTDKLKYSKERLSEWAEGYEREHGGKIYCEQRVENNNRRRDAKQDKDEFPRYKDPQMDQKTLISKLYHESDSGKAFQAALAEHGFSLAQGKRIVVIDENGKAFSLSRQVDGVRAKDIRAKLADIQLAEVSEARNGEGKAPKPDAEQKNGGDKEKTAGQDEKQKQGSPTPHDINAIQDRQHRELGDFYTRNQNARAELKSTLDGQYGANERNLRSEISALEDVLGNSGKLRRFWLKLTGRLSFRAEQDLVEKRQSLENIEMRKHEAEQSLESRIRQEGETIQDRHTQDRDSPSPAPASAPAQEFASAAAPEEDCVASMGDMNYASSPDGGMSGADGFSPDAD